jgi:hypothetical protein
MKMPVNKNVEAGLYKGLKELSSLSFPKVCPTCGKSYKSVDEFVSETESMRESSGMKEDLGDNDEIIVSLFRNCICGSTLMDEFNNRRDLSPTGLKRREKFRELINRLTNAGFSAEIAREELLKIMRGGESKLLNVKNFTSKSGKKK